MTAPLIFRCWVCRQCAARRILYGGHIPERCGCGGLFATDTFRTPPLTLAFTPSDIDFLRTNRIDPGDLMARSGPEQDGA